MGGPAARPAVAAERDGRRIAVWASWNGATAITRWQLLAGADPARLAPAGGPVAFDGLETRILLARPAAFVAVRALGRGGEILGESAPSAVPGRGGF